MARQKFLKVVANTIDNRGTISVLRGTVKDSGVTVRMCWSKPANALTRELRERYEANRCGVVRQLHHSESNPADSLDLALFVNGIPVATAELKNPLTAPDRRARDGAVPHRPQPARPDLRQAQPRCTSLSIRTGSR